MPPPPMYLLPRPVQLPGIRELQVVGDPPTIGAKTTLGQYCARVVTSVLKSQHGQKDPYEMMMVSLEITVGRCVVYFERI